MPVHLSPLRCVLSLQLGLLLFLGYHHIFPYVSLAQFQGILHTVAIIISHPQFCLAILSLSKFWWWLVTLLRPNHGMVANDFLHPCFHFWPVSSAVLPPLTFQGAAASAFNLSQIFTPLWLNLCFSLFWSLLPTHFYSLLSLSCLFSYIFTFHIPSLWSLSPKTPDFPGGLKGKESACSAGDLGSIPGSGRSRGEGNSNPLQDSCLENPMDRRAWQAIQPMGSQRVRHDGETFTFQKHTIYQLITPPQQFLTTAHLFVLLYPHLWNKFNLNFHIHSKTESCLFLKPYFPHHRVLVYRGEKKVKVPVTQSCPTQLCNPINCSLPGSSVHGIHQARILEWVAIPFSRGCSGPRGQIPVSHTAGRFFTIWATREDWYTERKYPVNVE